ncbi:unnamed protein product [Cuscuta epithymum]|uniref:RRM domain-containing protein n=1 Tax=Cuscuta epithymum TaxID=186058 RepID=A0AAV0GLW5_9ASTE|nr:unnamed protein product [Cuscuta epithymum]CAH9148967.1 unnamed protein product [Cuscuta epithymum]
MGRFNQEKEMSAYNNTLFQSNCNEGTSARTRPFSFDEIMLRRKNKSDIEEIKDSFACAAVPFDGENSVKRTFDCLASDRSYDASLPSNVRHNFKDSQLLNSRKKEGNDEESKLLRCKKKASRESETKQDAVCIDTSTKNMGRYKIDNAPHGGRKKDDKSLDDSEKRRGNRNANDEARKLAGRSGKTHEKERNEAHHDKDNTHSRKVYRKRKSDEFPNNASEDESEKRHSRNHRSGHKDKKKESYEKESSRKHQNEDAKRAKDRSAHKKHESTKVGASFFPERKDSKRAHYGELRNKRRRSRSTDHGKDNHRKSRSLSPKAHKHSSHDMRDMGESNSHSSKDKFGRSNIESDRNKISNNGETSHSKRHAGVTSGLGGYSPRKRKSEAAAKTPSPTKRSPEKRIAGWDRPPATTERNFPAPVVCSVFSSAQSVSLNTLGSFGVTTASLFATKPAMFFQNSYSPSVHAVESVQLTQATRPLRTLYVENLPNSVSDKDVMECINKFLLSSGANRIQGTKPCISCMIHKEKAQGLLEFLTPEDASAALSFDGRSISGSILKIRRPKDFIEVGTGVGEISQAAVDRTSGTVINSPYKIFVGGISDVISSDMLMEIAKSFGHLKAYHFELNAGLNEPCAFLEYIDHSVTAKACAGLNGMKLGGKVLTVVQAIPDASLVENVENLPYYGIPDHAKPLLESPTEVLKLKNMFDHKGLSDQELEELMDDIRLECARFGTVKSINVIKDNECTPIIEPVEVMHNDALTESKAVLVDSPTEDKLADDPVEMGISVSECPMVVCGNDCVSSPKSQEIINGSVDTVSSAEKLEVDDSKLVVEEELELNEYHVKLEAPENEAKGNETNPENIFEPGCVLIEYRRAEASCMAAHCLHGRIFDDRIVTVEYVAHDLYRKKFYM